MGMNQLFGALVFLVLMLNVENANSFCESPIFCKGELLDELQRAQIVSDSKVHYIIYQITERRLL